MRWARSGAVAVAALAVSACIAVPALAWQERPAGAGDGEVAIFYYPWYGTVTRDGEWEHWQQNGREPPVQIASGWYPARGVYSSSDPKVVGDQMKQIAAAGVNTVIVSWWGPGSNEARRLPLVARAARAAGLRVAVHVEPFVGRTPATLVPLLQGLTHLGISEVYIYDSPDSPDTEWKAMNAALPGLHVFANTNLPGKAKAGGFAGLYTYDVLVYDGDAFARTCASARMLGLLCAPSVGPGFDSSRATGDPNVKSRANGATYDRMWRRAIQAAADVVTITSYNEWHEGTQIEPARRTPGYASYDGAYGLRGRAAERAYLDRTAYWVGRYHQSLAR